jgi:hypothetical protein
LFYQLLHSRFVGFFARRPPIYRDGPSVLWLFDELVKCDEEGVLKDVRKAVEGVE